MATQRKTDKHGRPRARGRARSLVAISSDGQRKLYYASVTAFLRDQEPEPIADIDRWGNSALQEVVKCLDGKKKSYGGWRFLNGDEADADVPMPKENHNNSHDYEKTPDEKEDAEADKILRQLAAGWEVEDPEQVKKVLRRQQMQILKKQKDLRDGKEVTKGWKAKEDLEMLRQVAEGWGIPWSQVTDTRTEADKMEYAVNLLLQNDPTEIFALLDPELDALENGCDQAVEECYRLLAEIAKDEERATDYAQRKWHPDFSERDDFVSQQPEWLRKKPAEDADESQSPDEAAQSGGDDPGEAGLDGDAGGRLCRPAPGSQEPGDSE